MKQIPLDQIPDKVRSTNKGTEHMLVAAILMSVACIFSTIRNTSGASLTALSAAICWSVYGIRCETLKYILTLTEEIQRLKADEKRAT
jgi:hypothetical protein